MANDKKAVEKKSEAPSPVVAAVKTPDQPEIVDAPAPATGSAAALVKAGIVVPTIADLDQRVAAAEAAMERLTALATSTDLSEDSRRLVGELLKQANPNKPGMEEVNTTWTVTRINIAQPTTQAAAKPDSAKQGDLFTQAGMVVERPFSFIPLWFHEENVLFPEGAKVPECSAPDAKLGQPFGLCLQCPHLPFGKQNGGRGDQKQTDCQNQIVVAVLSSKLDAVYIITFAKTSRRAGNALISLAKNDAFPWKKSYLLQTEKKVGDKGTYFMYKVEPTGKENSPDVIKVAEALNALYGANRKKMLGDWIHRAANSTLTAALHEQAVDPALLMGGLGGEEPDLDAPSTPSVRGASKPM